MEFNEKNVRNAIISIRNVRELGEELRIPPHLLDDVEKEPPDHQKLKLVEVWFKVDVDCKWNTLEKAMKAVELLQWTRGRKSTSCSISEEPWSPNSNSSSDNSTGTPGIIHAIVNSIDSLCKCNPHPLCHKLITSNLRLGGQEWV